MLCIGNKVIVLFVGVEIINNDNVVIVKGFKGEFICEFLKDIEICVEGIEVIFYCLNDLKEMKIIYGIICVFLNNMVVGVLEGFKKEFEMCGVGYCV